jgi:molybdopterin-guanine dinucleotide biosynthesis protein A
VAGLSGAILMGGDSRRMGRDKAALRLDGRPLLHHVHDVLHPLCTEILLVTRDDRRAGAEDLAPAGCRIVTDVLPGRGPLVGLHAALQAAAHDRVLLVGGDMPCLSPGLLQAMAAAAAATGADVTIARLDRFEPLHAVYGRGCLAPIAEALAAGPAPVPSFFPAVAVNIWTADRVRAFDPDLRSFLNVNTPEDLAALE